MSNKVRDTLGKFVPKPEAPRKIRSINLTDDAWHWLATVAEKAGVSRNDYLEVLASSNLPFVETVRIEVDSPTDEVEAVRAENQRLHIELGNSAREKESPCRDCLSRLVCGTRL